MRTAVWCIGVLAVLVAALLGYLYLAGRPPQVSPAQYVAMGSSYASVVAAGGSRRRAPDSPVFCMRANDNYPHQLARMRGLSLVDVSCGGAVTRHVLSGGQLLQPAQLDALRPETELVTLTIGGNDIQYVGNLMAYGCHLRTRWYWRAIQAVVGCKALPQAEVESRLAALPRRLEQIAAEVHRRSPRARLVMLTYQTVLPPAGTCERLGLSEAQADQMRAVTVALANATRGAAAGGGALLFDAAAATAGHDVCAADPWMTGQTDAVPLHTTLDGMTAIAQGLNQMLDAAPAPGGS